VCGEICYLLSRTETFGLSESKGKPSQSEPTSHPTTPSDRAELFERKVALSAFNPAYVTPVNVGCSEVSFFNHHRLRKMAIIRPRIIARISGLIAAAKQRAED